MADVTISGLSTGIPNKDLVIPYSQGGTTFSNNLSSVLSPYNLSFGFSNITNNQTVPTNTETEIVFQSTSFNYGFTTESNQRVYIPVNGIYSFSCYLLQNTFANTVADYSDWQYTITRISVNSTIPLIGNWGSYQTKESASMTASVLRKYLGFSSTFKLNKGDLIKLSINVGHSKTTTIALDNYRWWSGFLVHPTN